MGWMLPFPPISPGPPPVPVPPGVPPVPPAPPGGVIPTIGRALPSLFKMIPAAIWAALRLSWPGRIITLTAALFSLKWVWDWFWSTGSAIAGHVNAILFWRQPDAWVEGMKHFSGMKPNTDNQMGKVVHRVLSTFMGLNVNEKTVQQILDGEVRDQDMLNFADVFTTAISDVFNLEEVKAGYQKREPGQGEQDNFRRFVKLNARLQMGKILADNVAQSLPFGVGNGIQSIADGLEKITGLEDAQEEILEPLMEKLIVEGWTKYFNRETQPVDLTPADAVQAEIAGLLLPGQLKKILLNEGVREDIHGIILRLRAKDLTQAEVQDYYNHGEYTRDELEKYFQQNGYLPAEARSKASLVQLDRLWKLQAELVNCKEAQFVNGVIDEASFRQFLSLHHYDNAEEEVQVEISKCKMTLVKGKTEKQITGTFNVTAPKKSAGGASVMSWNIRNATRVVITDMGEVEHRGELLVYPTETRTYYLDATSDTDQERFAAVVVVPGTVEQKRPTVTFSASPGRVTLGTQVELKWTVKNATSMSIDGIGPIPESGVQIVMPLQTTIYTLRASNAVGETIRQDAVFVSLPAIDFDLINRPKLSFSITPLVVKTKPPQAEMHWSITNATEGEIEYPDGTKAKVGRVGALIIHPAASGIYTLRASNGFGETKDEQAVILEVEEGGPPGPGPDPLPPQLSLSVYPQTAKPGDTVSVTWTLAGAQVGELLLPNTPLRPVGMTGSDTWVASPTPGTYEVRLQASNANGPSQQSVIVVVSA